MHNPSLWLLIKMNLEGFIKREKGSKGAHLSELSHEEGLPDSLSFSGSRSRKASVQRYREKQKDRFKSKKKAANPSSASLDIYLNHQIGNQTQNECSNRSDACSPPQIRPPNTPTRYSTMDNIVKNANLSIALNDKGASLGNEFSTSSLANNGAEGSLAHLEIPTVYVSDTRSAEEGPHISVVSNSDRGFHIDNRRLDIEEGEVVPCLEILDMYE